MVELSQLYEEVARLVEQQETPVVNIEQDADNTRTHIQDANKNIDGAIVSARKARKWKWIILLIISMLSYFLFLIHDTSANSTIVVVIIGVAVGVGVGVSVNHH